MARADWSDVKPPLPPSTHLAAANTPSSGGVGGAARLREIRRSQTDLLYDGVKFSAFGSVLAAAVVVWTLAPAVGLAPVAIWFVVIVIVYGARMLDLLCYRRRANGGAHADVDGWRWRVRVGALAASIAWCTSLLLAWPAGHPTLEVLLVLMLGGVASGALATLPYDARLSAAFQGIILGSVQLRLWVEPEPFTPTLALFTAFVFGFLLACGRTVGRNYVDLLSLRQDQQETNVALWRDAGEMARLGYWQWPMNTASIDLSTKLADMLGLAPGPTRIGTCYQLVHPEDRDRVRDSVRRAAIDGEEAHLELRVRAHGTADHRHMKQTVKPVTDSKGSRVLLGTMQDVSDVKRAAERIFELAYYDELTKLANRVKFHDELAHRVAAAGLLGRRLACIYIDLDDFKGVNDAFGHERADAYLAAIAARLDGAVRRGDPVARIGGDEFAVLVREAEDERVVERTVARVLETVTGPIDVGTHRIQPKLSAGFAIYPDDAATPDGLLSCAALAMAHAKLVDASSAARYGAHMEAERVARVRLEADLRHALEHEQFELWYQPKIDLVEGRMSGVEALIRWRHPERGLLPPALFIDVAERVGMICEIGDWVLRTACAQRARWKAAGLRFEVAINVSGEHFVRPDFVDSVARALDDHGLDGDELEIEITESLSRDAAQHRAVCRRLRALGVRIAIDDFGTGYSSLSVIGSLEIDTLKIDRAFVADLPHASSSRLLVESIVGLSRGLGHGLVAEGVETIEQLECVRRAGCRTVQGYYFSRPVEAALVPELARRCWNPSDDSAVAA